MNTQFTQQPQGSLPQRQYGNPYGPQQQQFNPYSGQGISAGPIYLSGGQVHGGYNNGQAYGYGAQQQYGQQQQYGGYGQPKWMQQMQQPPLNNQSAPTGQWGYSSNYNAPQPMQQNPMQQRQPVYNAGQIGRGPMGYFRPGSMAMGMANTPYNKNVW